MSERPNLDNSLDSKTFKEYYYLKEELVNFCRKNNLQTTGGKIELTERIAKDSFGVRREYISSYEADEGAFDAIKELGSTKHIIAGHDHVNSFVIRYEGVRFIQGLKTGAGCYWNQELNGGTVLTVTKDGITDVRHEYVDASAYIVEEEN